MSTATTPRGLWKVVAQREITTQVRSKSFVITFALLVASIVGMIIAFTLMSGRTSTHEIAVIDQPGQTVVTTANDNAKAGDADVRFTISEFEDAEAAEKAVTDGDVDAALLPSSSGYDLVGQDDVDTSITQWVGQTATQLALERNAGESGVDLGALTSGTQVGERLLDPDAGDNGLRQVAAFVFVLLFYLMALGYGMQIAATVTQEKESRVVEILAAAVPVRAMLWGKVIGSSVLAIGQTVVLAAVGVIALLVTDNGHALSVVGPAIGWYVLFFVLGFIALATLWTVAGSLAGRQQDLNGTTAPLQMILFAPYILAVTAGAGVKTVVSMLPIVSTMMMPYRLAEGDVPMWQLGVAVGTTVLAAVLLVRLSASIYERTLLQTGRRITFKEAIASSRKTESSAA
ncbi:ABC transporter permease [Nocardioides sp. R-C-SC26]|uniref:ABC transporter permease n=1 Tax=Nocardioides sp. R-C-SC26 TaxID=2870414 RepID=UPI001E647406|nr:ABC transporter permease [Nocardioides sp. R-C-SC26]